MARDQQSYSAEQQAKALAVLVANGGNLSRTAKELSIPRNTLRLWMKRQGLTFNSTPNSTGSTPPVETKAQAVSHLFPKEVNNLADACDRGVFLCLDFKEEDVRKASVRDRAYAAGVLIDKRQLLMGKATSIGAKELTDEERRRGIEELLSEVESGLETNEPPIFSESGNGSCDASNQPIAEQDDAGPEGAPGLTAGVA